MKIIASATGRYITTCKFCMSAIAETPPLDVPLTGEPGKKVERLTKILVKHLMTEHPDRFAEGIAFNQNFPAFLIFSGFQFEDPSISERLEHIRAGIFQLVRKNTISDASLQHVVASFGFDPEDATKCYEALRAVRDACCELGERYSNLQNTSTVVTA